MPIYNPAKNNVQKITKTYLDFSAAALTNDIEIFTLKAGHRLVDVTIVPTVAFTGGIVSAATISVGVVGNLVKFANAFTVFTLTGVQDSNNFSIEDWSSGVSIRASLTTVLGNINTLTAGSVDIYIETIQIKS